MQEFGGSLAKAKGVRIGKSVEIVQGVDRSGMRRLPPKSCAGSDKGNEEEKWWSYWRRWNKVEGGRNKFAQRCFS